MKPYLTLPEHEFEAPADGARALKQKAWMRNQFDFFGLTSPVRREIQKPFLAKESLPDEKELKTYIEPLAASAKRISTLCD